MDLLPAGIWCVLRDIFFRVYRDPFDVFHARTQNDASVKAAKEGAFKATAEWLIKYL